MNGNRSLRNLLLWVVPFALVLAILGWETDWGDGVSLPVPGAAAAAPQPVDVVLLPQYTIDGGLAARRETVDRVLFNPTRRPAPPATQTAAGASAISHGKYVLTGTTVAGDVATAMLREVAGGKSHTVRKGDKIDGVLVADVTPDSVKLTLGSDSEELHLKVAVGPTTTAPAPLAAAPIPGVPVASGLGGSAAAAQAQARENRFLQRVAPTPLTAQPGAPVSFGQLMAERRRAAAAAAGTGGTAPPQVRNPLQGLQQQPR